MTVKRPITSMVLPNVEPGELATATPEFRWTDPASLLVDEAYQRELSRGSIDLIRKIVAGWDWNRFKPPVVAETDEGLEVIDGQHTAIAAATHPGVEQIPVMVVRAAEVADRAKAFVGHNRDRLVLSQVAIHYANVAAGDEDALTTAKRIKQLQTGCPYAIQLLAWLPGGAEREQALHRRFKAYRAQGEWFHAAPELLAFVADINAGRAQ